MPSKLYDPERVRRLAEIESKFRSHAAVGDRIKLGIEGDPHIPYRGTDRPCGVVTRIKNEGRENATLRVQLDAKYGGGYKDLLPYSVDGGNQFEFEDDTWKKVLYRSGAAAPEYKGNTTGGDDVSRLRKEMEDIKRNFAMQERQLAEAKQFNSAMVESVAQLTGEIAGINPNAKFSRVFQEEYRAANRGTTESAFHSDAEFSDDD